MLPSHGTRVCTPGPPVMISRGWSGMPLRPSRTRSRLNPQQMRPAVLRITTFWRNPSSTRHAGCGSPRRRADSRFEHWVDPIPYLYRPAMFDVWARRSSSIRLRAASSEACVAPYLSRWDPPRRDSARFRHSPRWPKRRLEFLCPFHEKAPSVKPARSSDSVAGAHPSRHASMRTLGGPGGPVQVGVR